MAIYVNTNVNSLHGQRKLANVHNQLDVSHRRLASGLRINTAKDDAAGLQISEQITTQINGLDQGNRNANDGLALLQTIDGAVDEINNTLQRVRTLLVQAANGTYSNEDRLTIQKDVEAALLGASAIGTDTTFAGKKILMGHLVGSDDIYEPIRNGKNHMPGTLRLQVGANDNQQMIAKIKNFFVPELMIDKKYPNGAGGNQTAEDISNGAFIIDKDVDDTALGMKVDISTQQLASDALKAIDFVINEVSARRAEVGSYMNRLESSIRNQSNVSENESDTRSRLRDTDFASETASHTQKNIIQQSATSILSQANSRPNIAITLLTKY